MALAPTTDIWEGITESAVTANGVRLNVATAGVGSPILFVHGFPHTWQIWMPVMSTLSARHHVIAPDLRGLGRSERAECGYDAQSVAADLRAVLDAADIDTAMVVAIDAGVPPAFTLAMEHPGRVSHLILSEALVGTLPGAEDFLANGPPWWFAFHAIPGFAERVLAGHEREYIDFFLRAGVTSADAFDERTRSAILDSYADENSLRCGFEYYRSMPQTNRQIARLTENARLTVPVTTVGGSVVGDATRRQLEPIANELHAELLPSSGHIVPLERPDELVEIIRHAAGDEF
ncbi:alpha/beta fold hydrolase [Paramicrobacterium fandaimingii]|uniref:alpha/beta fold hydrolase n=1 Tax=Paramicrobacterium fandaimingii TaxID=2708079 RepID=UPI001424069D|nr:alpha/beta hydrolase [Microbacterium fandaimingii]